MRKVPYEFKVRPIGEWCLLQPLEIEEKSKGGILLASVEDDKAPLLIAEVVAIGNGDLARVYGPQGDRYVPVKAHFTVGDTVIYQRANLKQAITPRAHLDKSAAFLLPITEVIGVVEL